MGQNTYLLLAIDDVVLAIGRLLSSGRDVTDVRSGRRFRDSKADSLFTAKDLGNDLLLEKLGCVLLKRGCTDGLR